MKTIGKAGLTLQLEANIWAKPNAEGDIEYMVSDSYGLPDYIYLEKTTVTVTLENEHDIIASMVVTTKKKLDEENERHMRACRALNRKLNRLRQISYKPEDPVQEYIPANSSDDIPF